MKLLKGLLLLAPFILMSSAAQAMDLRMDISETKSFLTASGEFSQFTLEEGSIMGTGFKADFINSFADKLAMSVYLSSGLNPLGGSSFTGLGGYTYYNLLGECCATVRTVSIDGKPTVTETTVRGQNLQIGIGLDQFFLNGSKSVYSASGLGLSMIYQFALFKYNFKAEARHSQLNAGTSKIQGNFVSLGIVFAL